MPWYILKVHYLDNFLFLFYIHNKQPRERSMRLDIKKAIWKIIRNKLLDFWMLSLCGLKCERILLNPSSLISTKELAINISKLYCIQSTFGVLTHGQCETTTMASRKAFQSVTLIINNCTAYLLSDNLIFSKTFIQTWELVVQFKWWN